MSLFRRLATALLILGFAGAARADDFRDLFNGKDLDGWVIEGPKEFKNKKTGQVVTNWSVQEGMIVAGGAYGFLRYDKQEFGDFTIRVEYRMEKKPDGEREIANSGLGIRTCIYDPKKSGPTRPSNYSYEIQLLDDAGKNPDKHSSGSLYRHVAPKVNAVKPAPEWNTVEVTCVGPRIRVVINDVEVLDVDQTTIDALKTKPLKGYVCLQSHSRRVEFRSVRIREITPGTGTTK